MSTQPAASFLDFFVLEASEYVEQIDGMLARAGDSAPDADALQRAARALRGSATMAKLSSFSELASSVEAVGRALKQGSLNWHEALKGALNAAVDDLKILVRAARSWSPAEDQWAMKRVAELGQFVKVTPSLFSSTTPVTTTSPSFFVNETSNIAAGLELLATRPDDRAGAVNVLKRIRALRGVAGVRDIPALAEVSESAESSIRPLELGETRLTDQRVNLLRAAADLLRSISSGLASGQSVTTETPQYRSFLSALDAALADVAGADRIIAIADLFYNDAGPHMVSKATNPPTTPAQRFRMEVVSLGEHLHRVIAEARAATDPIQREHARGELGRALRAIRATAASFGQMAVAQTVEAYLERTGDLNVSALDSIASFATTISPAAVAPTPAMQPAIGQARLTQPRQVVTTSKAPGGPSAPSPTSTSPSSSTPAESHARVFTSPEKPATSLKSVAMRLDDTIATFDSLAGERLAERVAADDEIVPMDALVYRGKAALDRALELRDVLRRAGSPPPPELLEELYDLVELARGGMT